MNSRKLSGQTRPPCSRRPQKTKLAWPGRSKRDRPAAWSWYNGSSLGPHVLNGYGSMTSVPINTIYGTGDPALVDMWRTSHQNMKYKSSLRRRVITGGSQKDVRVSRRMDCRIGLVKFHVSANNWKVTSNIDHVSYMWVYMLFVCGIEIDD